MDHNVFSLPIPPLSPHDVLPTEDIDLEEGSDDLLSLPSDKADSTADLDEFESLLVLDAASDASMAANSSSCRDLPAGSSRAPSLQSSSPSINDDSSSPGGNSPQDSGSDQPSSSSRWTLDARIQHSALCTGKKRLTSQQKTDIVRLYYSSGETSKRRRAVQQWDLARMYGKSRSAISRLLKPETAARIMRRAGGETGEEVGEVLARIEAAKR
ncbi:hypothetical protein GUITHDRAFT_119890 [Guillardia theta CCMP2712]|uniref:Uncharacterized protein n=1 Tax=Guillardia theta (strain CCMP2712) TaxID=905079 RepID=L1ICV3_GUITC|nr:hypothetical protein GUITHDRAFT_119890 [Guillardia theta CCMP2712]EKX33907.1 hypothetical protein GUITHDRAFT_119890 [Guillardia theta CCMP2712]|eukprot:XP_005820887.1 hypothetical protein GUITHDRAFT_119890 [Guillardia theta CCMP2712]